MNRTTKPVQVTVNGQTITANLELQVGGGLQLLDPATGQPMLPQTATIDYAQGKTATDLGAALDADAILSPLATTVANDGTTRVSLASANGEIAAITAQPEGGAPNPPGPPAIVTSSSIMLPSGTTLSFIDTVEANGAGKVTRITITRPDDAGLYVSSFDPRGANLGTIPVA